MDEFAKGSPEDRREAFQETSAQKGVSFQIAEKDFWVCWTLRRLFGLEKFDKYFVFKGGTSLSKVYNVIQRFSEDIDVAIEREFLVETKDGDFIGLSSKQRERNVEELDKRCRTMIETEILTQLKQAIALQLGASGWSLKLDADDPYRQTILFEYPKSTSGEDKVGVQYVRPIVKIEFGARPTNEPSETHVIKPYVAELFPQLFNDPTVELKVLAAERTFWEKATILHELYNRPPEYIGRDRSSRHYYDLYQLIRHDHGWSALERVDILKSVVANKNAYFYRGGAKYDETLIGKFHLLPNERAMGGILSDYNKMAEMIFGDPPKFENILSELGRLEPIMNERITASESNSS